MSNKQLDFTKPVQTRDGRKVRIICTNAGLVYQGVPNPIIGTVAGLGFPMSWADDGSCTLEWGEDRSLVQVPEPRTMFINVYPKDYEDTWHQDKNTADTYARPSRIGCVEVKYTVDGVIAPE
jgi:hypothetical protein